ncbi:MAG: ATP-dependent helicase [Acidimicrobiaceae bacterium]|jgi:superfamily II DNA or RNA helicase|nr:ATP-dependent helicase [Acidimicrobiaceae bacterium]
MTRTIRLRPWQRAALDRFAAEPGPDFLAVATPGAGKTTFALAAARQVLSASPGRLIVVVPTAHLKLQWARAAAELDLHLDDGWSPSQGQLPPDMHGIVTTYQQVATAAAPLARLARGAFVVLDEVHHAGDDRAWGESLRIAFADARRRLSLSGTPFRSDTRSIPFVRYELDEARPDFEYGYGEALAERRVVRPVFFPRTNGHMEWSAPDGEIHAATFDDPLDVARSNQRLRTALSLEGQWLPEVLVAAHARLCEIRKSQSDAGGLVIAMDQEHARGIAELMARELRTSPVVATSDDPGASAAIAAFAGSARPWLVAVRMVSEGVDIPRLRVGVYATTTTTELFFRQAVGRFVRWLPGIGRQAAYLFIPDDARLRSGAAQIAEARRHSLRRKESAERPARLEGDWDDPTPDAAVPEEQLSLFSVISAVATDAVDLEGEGVDEPLLPDDDPSLVFDLGAPPPLARAAETSGAVAGVGAEGAMTRSELKEQLRAANSAIARALARRTGWSHAKVNAELNRLSGLAKVTEATLAQLESRLRHGERWLSRA